MNQKRQHPASFAMLSLVLCGAAIVVLCVPATIGWRMFRTSPGQPVNTDSQSSSDGQTPQTQPQTDSPPQAEMMPAIDADANAGQEVASQAPEPPSEQVDEIRRLLTGTWEDDYQGKRTMTLSADGTGTMVVELSGLSGTLFGSRLKFEMQWSLDEGRLIKRTVGGEPEGKVKTILAMMGDRAEEEIIELTDQRLLVEDIGMQKKFDWRRVPADAQR